MATHLGIVNYPVHATHGRPAWEGEPVRGEVTTGVWYAHAGCARGLMVCVGGVFTVHRRTFGSTSVWR
jgi:hypothetical protein